MKEIVLLWMMFSNRLLSWYYNHCTYAAALYARYLF